MIRLHGMRIELGSICSKVHEPVQKSTECTLRITDFEFLTLTLLRYFKIPQQWDKRHDSGTAHQLQARFACPTYATSHANACPEKDEALATDV